MLWTTEGHFVAQVSDLYVVASTRRRWPRATRSGTTRARPPTTGATSLLHTARAGARARGGRARRRARGLRRPLRGGALPRLAAARRARSARGSRGSARGCWPAVLVALCGPGGLGLPVRLRHRSLPVPRPAAARSLARVGGAAAGAAGVALAGALAGARPARGPAHRPRPGARGPLARAGASRRERLWLVAGRRRARRARAAARLTGSWLRPRSPRSRCWPNYGPVETVGRRLRVRRRRAARAAARLLPVRGAHRLLAAAGGLLLPAARPRASCCSSR